MKLQTSTDYSQFEMLDFNRDVTKTRKLEASMRAHGWIPAYPAHVVKEKGKLKIKAGHHRFTVAARLGIPVVYVICDDNSTVHELERATNKWSLQDYLTSYVRLGDQDYDAVSEYHKRTGITLHCCISLLAGECACSSNHLNRFKAGEYKVKNTKHAERVAKIIATIKSAGIKWATDKLVVQSVSRIVMCDAVNPDTLLQKIAKNKQLIEKQPSLSAYTEMFDLIYNHNSRNKIPLSFLVDKAMLERQATFKTA